MVESLIVEGQLQAVVCRKVQGSKLKLVLGNRRWHAVNKINSSPELLARAGLPEGEKLKIRIKVKDLNDEEAFRQNLTENMVRADLSPLDHAHNQRLLRERFHWTEQKIAKFYNQSTSYVSLLKRGHQIPAELQELIRDKKLSLSDGLGLTDLPEQEQIEVVKENQDANGHVSTEGVRRHVRRRNGQQGGKKALTVKEIRKFWERVKEENERAGQSISWLLLPSSSLRVRSSKMLMRSPSGKFSKASSRKTSPIRTRLSKPAAVSPGYRAPPWTRPGSPLCG